MYSKVIPLYIYVYLLMVQFLKNKVVYYFGCDGASLVHGLLSSCRKLGLLSSCGSWASHSGGFSCKAWALGHGGFSSCGTWAQQLWYMGSIAVAQ